MCFVRSVKVRKFEFNHSFWTDDQFSCICCFPKSPFFASFAINEWERKVCFWKAILSVFWMLCFTMHVYIWTTSAPLSNRLLVYICRIWKSLSLCPWMHNRGAAINAYPTAQSCAKDSASCAFFSYLNAGARFGVAFVKLDLPGSRLFLPFRAHRSQNYVSFFYCLFVKCICFTAGQEM